jgi:hypothetical protein
LNMYSFTIIINSDWSKDFSNLKVSIVLG